jgi:Mg2+/Co2+ transporter CorC
METGDRVAIIKAQSKMHDVVPEMANKRGICVVTNDSNDVLGVLTAGDLNRLLKKGEQFFDLTVSEAMTKIRKWYR